MNDQRIGYRDVTVDPPNKLLGAMNQSPTGRQLAIDGNLIAPLFDGNPALNDVNVPPNCTFGFWIDGATLWLATFTRDTGWVSVQLTA